MRKLIVVLAALLLVALPLIGACGGDDEEGIAPTPTVGVTPTLTPPEVMAMLRDSVANAPEVTSYRFQIESTQIEEGEEITGSTTAEYTTDGMRVRTVTSDSAESEQINVGGKMYSRSGAGPWEVIDFPNQCWSCSANSGFEGAIATVIDAEVVGEEEVRGVLTVHVKGLTDMAARVKQMWPDYDTADPEEGGPRVELRDQWLAATEHVDLWLGKEDNLVRQMRYQTSFPAIDGMEAYSVDATFSYFDYNVEMVIEAPAVP